MAASIPVQLERAPLKEPIVGSAPPQGVWPQWLNALVRWVNRAAVTVGVGVTASAQSASIGATAVPTGTLEAGIYRVTYYARITRAATTSSSLTVTIGWTDGVAQTETGAAMTGNLTTTWQRGGGLIALDAGTSVTYAAAYSSVGATAMQYALAVRLEKLP